MRVFWLSNTASNVVVNLASWSRIRNRTGSMRSPIVHATCRACCVTHAASGCAVHPASRTRRLPISIKEEHVQPLEPDRVDREEIHREDAVRLSAQKLAP